MSDQPDLWDWVGPADVETKFAEFDAAHPEVWEMFLHFTFMLIHHGCHRHSARDVIHRIRWETTLRADDGRGWKINDHWSPYYARKFHRAYPQHGGFFETRKAKADREAA